MAIPAPVPAAVAPAVSAATNLAGLAAADLSLLPPTDPVLAGEAMGVTRRFVEFHLDRRLSSLAVLGD